MRVTARALGSLLVLLVLGGACRNGGGEERPARTGVAAVDAVVRAVLARDGEALAALSWFSEYSCTLDYVGLYTTPEGVLHCTGATSLVAVELLPIAPPNTTFVRRGDAPAFFQAQLTALQPLYGALKHDPPLLGMLEYEIVLRGPEAPTPTLSLYLWEGRIVYIGRRTVTGTETLPPPDHPRWLIPPRDSPRGE